jgi:integrase/recombinase XerD
MLRDLFPKVFQRYLSLPVLGSILNEFAKFIHKLGYPRCVVRRRLQATPAIDRSLQQLRCGSIIKINRAKLRACAPAPGKAKENASVAATITLLECFLDERQLLSPVPLTLVEKKLVNYTHYLQQVRGFGLATIQDHFLTASRFLIFLDKRDKFIHLEKISLCDIEDFISGIGNIVGRGRLQHIISHLRSFLRFLAMYGKIPTGLDGQIDTPRTYRAEKLPRSLDWKIVCDLLRSIDRSTVIGKRDYSILLFIATYGLRTSEIVNLKLEEIEWKTDCLRILQNKTATPLILPLTNAVGASILDYLRYGRPSVSYREIFVRHRAPSGVLKRTAVTDVFQAWSLRSGLPIPFKGPHCLRHSYAIHLLRQGIPLKTIGDILGHKNFESTCVYLRLNIEDLRTVPLSLPELSLSTKEILL